MNLRHYEPADAVALEPLIASIGREVEQRVTRLEEIEVRKDELDATPSASTSAELRELEVEACHLRRELRHCREELDNLGCSVVGTTPLTIRIPTRVDGESRSRMWQHGQPAG